MNTGCVCDIYSIPGSVLIWFSSEVEREEKSLLVSKMTT